MGSEDNLRLKIYTILKEQGILKEEYIAFNSEPDSDNLKQILSKVPSVDKVTENVI
jgi:hypothetical protein